MHLREYFQALEAAAKNEVQEVASEIQAAVNSPVVAQVETAAKDALAEKVAEVEAFVARELPALRSDVVAYAEKAYQQIHDLFLARIEALETKVETLSAPKPVETPSTPAPIVADQSTKSTT